jgi:hypothetical protein
MSRNFLQVFLLVIIFTSCKHKPEKEEIPLEFELISVIKKSGEGCLTDDFNCSIISLDLPMAKGPEEVAEKINSRLREHVFSLANSEKTYEALSYEEYAKEFIANKKRMETEFGEKVPWRAIVTGSVISQTDHLVSISIVSEIFTGGAHGYGSTSFFNFNPETGETFEHQDIFTEKFKDFAERTFRERYDIPEDQPINSTGFWFEDDAFHLPINIGIAKENVILIYNSYEVASYAEGDFRLEFSLEELDPFLKIELE